MGEVKGRSEWLCGRELERGALLKSDGVTLPLADYRAFHDALPLRPGSRSSPTAGAPPGARPRISPTAASASPILRFGNIVVGVQPGRGYGVDPKATYHDPLLPPPHHYLAFYAWLRTTFGADALVEIGKHGNLEWLPGKAVGLSAECWPRGDPRPGAARLSVHRQRSRRGRAGEAASAAVIIDHLMPPITRAEAHGPSPSSRR